MRERINKPRVFLSHARKDVAFIERIENDLRRCQIDSWRDQNEIRDGQPWMSAIFEDGIPTCDAILAYFTNNSLGSEMVAKEVDSAILRRLSDSKIAFLPYVDENATRPKLRIDIQTLNCRIWNEENYYEILPSIVAEIWRSFLERSLENAVLSERNRRLELELELQKINDGNTSVFSGHEENEFQYIYKNLNRDLEFSGIMYEHTVTAEGARQHPGKLAQYYLINMPLPDLICSFAKLKTQYDHWKLDSYLYRVKNIDKKSLELRKNEEQHFSFNSPDLTSELFIYGLLERQVALDSHKREEYVYFFSPKMNRFLFWIDFNNLVKEDFEIEIIEAESYKKEVEI